MQTLEGSAKAYDKLSKLTDQYNDDQARLQELRVLTRALRALAGTYCAEGLAGTSMFNAIATMSDAASVERNRLYQQSSRLTQEMERLNALIQNGVFNE